MLDYLNVDYLKYKWLKIMFMLQMNIGTDRYGFQFFKLHLIPKSKQKSDYLLKQHYETYDCWSVGKYFILIE